MKLAGPKEGDFNSKVCGEGGDDGEWTDTQGGKGMRGDEMWMR